MTNQEIDFIFRYLKKENEVSKSFLQNLLTIKLKNGDKAFISAMDEWYKKKDTRKWLNNNEQPFLNVKKINKILLLQNKWCTENHLNFTPCLLINTFQYPTKFYDIDDIKIMVA